MSESVRERHCMVVKAAGPALADMIYDRISFFSDQHTISLSRSFQSTISTLLSTPEVPVTGSHYDVTNEWTERQLKPWRHNGARIFQQGPPAPLETINNHKR